MQIGETEVTKRTNSVNSETRLRILRQVDAPANGEKTSLSNASVEGGAGFPTCCIADFQIGRALQDQER